MYSIFSPNFVSPGKLFPFCRYGSFKCDHRYNEHHRCHLLQLTTGNSTVLSVVYISYTVKQKAQYNCPQLNYSKSLHMSSRNWTNDGFSQQVYDVILVETRFRLSNKLQPSSVSLLKLHVGREIDMQSSLTTNRRSSRFYQTREETYYRHRAQSIQ